MKCTLAITRNCNLTCEYCYIRKNNDTMTLTTARNIVDFVFSHSVPGEKIDIGFFGGEPLIEFSLIQDIIEIIHNHDCYSPDRVTITITTNGTVLDEKITDFLIANSVVLCVSCDGPPEVQNKYRRFKNGKGSSHLVESNIKHLLKVFPNMPVNAVYSTITLKYLPDTVDYLISLGVNRLFINPDISANWTQQEASLLPTLFEHIGKIYIDHYLNQTPKYISIIDNKIAVILKGGYQPWEKCCMGDRELAFAPSGNVYPCERLIGNDDGRTHCLGNISDLVDMKKRCHQIPSAAINPECMDCSLSGYCMNWCGCTNYAMSGRYDLANPFLCASEKAAINAAFHTLQAANDNNINLLLQTNQYETDNAADITE
jgi:uncharacterized protein